jgi:hypothetical protein
VQRISSSRRVGGPTFFLIALGVLFVLPMARVAPGLGKILFVPVAAGWVTLSVRAARAGLYVAPDALTVRKVWSTRVIPRADVTELDWGMSWVPNFEACLLIRHVGGRPVLVPSVPAGRFFDTPEEGVAKLAHHIEQAYIAAATGPSLGQRTGD